ATNLHVPDGLGGLYVPQHSDVRDAPTGAAALGQLSRQASTASVILCTGPLTDLAELLTSDPGFTDAPRRAVVMGGAFGNPSGNVTPWAEFNFWADPLAASIACESVPLFIIPLDVPERVRFTTADREAL